jgi:alpha-L-fucosidase 2
MNYWAAELTGLNLVGPLFDYMEKTWVPRGEYTAQVLYNITRGWVTHNEVRLEINFSPKKLLITIPR